MNRLILAAATGLSFALLPLPASAQTVESREPTAEGFEAIGALFGDMFGTAEPLSPEEQARLEAAKLVVTKLFPVGTYTKMMEESMAPMMEQIMGGIGGSPALQLSKITGLDPLKLAGMDEARLTDALALLDPAASDRNAAMGEAMVSLISEVMVEMEPAYRSGLARAYAVRFTSDELSDLAAYFNTPVGEKYAAESFLIFADPQVMASMNEMMPAMMQRMPAMIEMMTAAGAEFPAGRSFSQLEAAERAQLAQLLGVGEDELAASEPAPATVQNLEL